MRGAVAVIHMVKSSGATKLVYYKVGALTAAY